MTYRQSLIVLLGLLLFGLVAIVLVCSAPVLVVELEAARFVTLNAVHFQQTAAWVRAYECDNISSALDAVHVCGGWNDFRTVTPSPTDPSLPTLNHLEVIQTSNHRTNSALGTVLAACATLKNFPGTIDPCPAIWAASTPAFGGTVTPTGVP
jgi:hypothetical protein